MYVCVCKAVTESRIRRAVDEGARTLRDLRRTYGVGSGCGKCVPHAYAVLSEAAPRAGAQMPDGSTDLQRSA